MIVTFLCLKCKEHKLIKHKKGRLKFKVSCYNEKLY